MSSKSTSKNNKFISAMTRYRWLAIAGLALVLIVIFDISPVGGNARFYSEWIDCGQKPVATRGSGFLNAGAIHYYEASAFNPIRGQTSKYFCTPLQAEQAGYSSNSNSYEFPHLDKQRSL